MTDAPVSTAPPARGTGRKPLSRFALAALVLAGVVALVAALSGLGARWGIWHFRTGFQLLRWSAYGGVAVVLLSLVAVYRAHPGGGRRGLWMAAAALVIGLVIVYVPWSWQRRARAVPPIHDVTTDLADPPEFVAIAPLRADAPNPLEHGGPEVAAQQREAYPDIRPLVLPLPRDRAFQRALDAAREMGWEIVAADPGAGRIEATDRTTWFGFRDDVVIRLTPLDGRTVLDVRSLSRVGGGDSGTNARRVRSYLAEVSG